MAKLIINPTAANRRELALDKEEILTIGRDPSNDLVLPDAMVSRRHAVVEQRGRQFFLRDCNSANGSVVNGDRVSERGLRDGDLVAIGSMRLLFKEEPAEPGAKVVPHPSAAPMRCESCGASYRRGDLFCRECGTEVPQPKGPPKAVCSSCGTAVVLPARFCPSCGVSLPPPEKQTDSGDPPGAEQASTPGEGASRSREAERKKVKDTQPVPPPAARKGPSRRLTDSAVRAPQVEPEAPPPPRPTRETPPSAPPVAVAERSVPPPARRVVVPRPSSPPRRSEASVPAGFGSRLAAGIVDAIFVLSGQAVLLAPVAYYWWSREVPRDPSEVPFLPIVTTVGLVALAALLGALYHVYSWGVRGSSPGKDLLELRVEADDGTSPIGLGRAGLRLLGYLLSAASLGIGFLMIASSGEGLHDRIAGTRVVRRGRS